MCIIPTVSVFGYLLFSSPEINKQMKNKIEIISIRLTVHIYIFWRPFTVFFKRITEFTIRFYVVDCVYEINFFFPHSNLSERERNEGEKIEKKIH